MNKFNFNANQTLSREQMKKIKGGSYPTCDGICQGGDTGLCEQDEGAPDCQCDTSEWLPGSGPSYQCF